MARKSHTQQTSLPLKARYRVTNWPDYNRALVQRGSVTLWLSDEVAGVRRQGVGAVMPALY